MKKINIFKLYFFLIASGCLVFGNSCTQIDIFEKNTAIPKYEWKPDFYASGDFLIADTVSAYNIYLVLRHTDAYLYNNIWLNVGLQAPGDSLRMQKVNLKLGNDANGWEGTGMNDIWEVRKLLSVQPHLRAGKYHFTIAQIMRDNPLLHILSVGLRLEKKKD